MSKKKSLSAEIKERCVILTLRIEDLAEACDVVHSTMRGWLGRNRFPADILPILERVLETTQRFSTANFDFVQARPRAREALSQDTPSSANEGFFWWWRSQSGNRRRTTGFVPSTDEIIAFINDRYSRAGEQDYFMTVFLDRVPWELEREHMESVSDSIALAVWNGATIAFLVPNEDTRGNRSWPDVLSIRNAEARYHLLVRSVAVASRGLGARSSDAGDRGPLSIQEREEIVKSRLLLLAVDDCGFFTPSTVETLWGSGSGVRPIERSYYRAPMVNGSRFNQLFADSDFVKTGYLRSAIDAVLYGKTSETGAKGTRSKVVPLGGCVVNALYSRDEAPIERLSDICDLMPEPL